MLKLFIQINPESDLKVRDYKREVDEMDVNEALDLVYEKYEGFIFMVYTNNPNFAKNDMCWGLTGYNIVGRGVASDMVDLDENGRDKIYRFSDMEIESLNEKYQKSFILSLFTDFDF